MGGGGGGGNSLAHSLIKPTHRGGGGDLARLHPYKNRLLSTIILSMKIFQNDANAATINVVFIIHMQWSLYLLEMKKYVQLL